ncbi:caspase domain-containing protein [Armillaria novae-zelandiae]|uniref:Caspase domain-containing protein n=1 Tax=Armillaria novae-zelandiae TaxID=153914 RepID=A0AA39PE67_9AGAR|nr:caspase domain-containing protein [Armillaria novae-zelandiae]
MTESQAQIPTHEVTQEPPRKRALLIGINQLSDEKGGPQGAPLVGPHADVVNMRKLLITKYGYKAKDIVTLMDNGGSTELQPTRNNILHHIARLVHEPKDGEYFFFHYSGHGTQTENMDGSEEDGLDECLIAMDGEIIKDDELRDRLIDCLPATCYMTAVLDACHSASLLDLEHFRCNRERRQRRDTIRWHTMDTSPRRTTYQLTDKKGIASRKTSIQPLINASFNNSPRVLAKPPSISSTEADSASCLDAIKQCESPMQISNPDFPVRACDGFCPLPSAKKRKMAKVVCISSCKDHQQTLEVSGGLSLTQTLIKKCSKDPYPLLADLMIHLKSENFKNFGKAFKAVQKYVKAFRLWQENYKKKNRLRPIPRCDSRFSAIKLRQDPQLSSPEPLDMDTIRWNP